MRQGSLTVVHGQEEGKGVALRQTFAIASLVLAAGSAHALDGSSTLLYSNAPATDPETGLDQAVFSDSYDSQGDNFYSFALGQKFSQVTNFTVKSLSFWGVSEYVFGGSQAQLSSNIIAIQVAIFRITPGNPEFPLAEGESSQEATWTLSRSQFTQVATGSSVDVGGSLSPVFRMDAALSGAFELAAGDYMITIGGVLQDPDGDAFAWVDGEYDGGNPATQAYGTRANQPGEWGRWIALDQAPDPSASGAVMLFGQGTPVPGPAAIALLGLAGRASRRRRAH